jgi:ribonuclease HI
MSAGEGSPQWRNGFALEIASLWQCIPAMGVPAPHFLLVSQAAVGSGDQVFSGRWRFELRTPDGHPCLEAADEEPETSPERLELLAIVRGLESLDEPARVTLVSAGRSISRGLRYGIAQWRENDWQWERYGKLTPIKNRDLWRRIDRAMAIHQIECRDPAATIDDLAAPPEAVPETADVRIIRHRGRRLRIDQPVRNDEGRRTNDQRMTNSKGRRTNQRVWFFRTSDLLRHSDFVIRILAAIRRVFA